jgi:Zn-dependent membrane protease YugP
MFFDPMYFLFVLPAFLPGLWALTRTQSSYAAAREILDPAGLNGVAIEPIPGQLTDHCDPRDEVLRLSEGVYEARSLAAVFFQLVNLPVKFNASSRAKQPGHSLHEVFNQSRSCHEPNQEDREGVAK